MKRLLKRKRVLFPIIFFGQIVIFILIAIIFGLETENSPLGTVYAYTLIVTLIGFCVKIIKDHKIRLTEFKMPIFPISALSLLYFAVAGFVLHLIILTLYLTLTD